MPEYPLLDLATQRPEPGHYVYRLVAGFMPGRYFRYHELNFWVRAGRHVQEHADWWQEVSWGRTILELVSTDACPHSRRCKLPGHAEMLRHEASLIRELQPRYNSQLTGYCRKGLHLLAEHGRVQLNGTVGCYTCQLARQAAQYDPALRRTQIARRKARQSAAAGQLTIEEAPT